MQSDLTTHWKTSTRAELVQNKRILKLHSYFASYCSKLPHPLILMFGYVAKEQQQLEL